MTRIRISAAVLFILSLISISSWLWTESRCDSISRDISHTEQLLRSGRYDEALACSADIEEKWKKFRKYASVVLKADLLSETDRICAGIRYRIEYHDSEAVFELEKMRHMLAMIKDSETPGIFNIF